MQQLQLLGFMSLHDQRGMSAKDLNAVINLCSNIKNKKFQKNVLINILTSNTVDTVADECLVLKGT